MKNILKALGRVKLVFRKSRPATKVMALCAVVLSMAALLTLQSAILESREQTGALLEQAAELEQQNQELKQRIDGLRTEEGIRDIAEQELGLVDPNTIMIVPQQ